MKTEIIKLQKDKENLLIKMNYMENNLKPVCKSMKSMISERDSDEDSDDDEGLVTIETLRDHISNTFELFKDDVSSRFVYTRCIQNWYQV